MNLGEKHRRDFGEAMRKIEVGASLRRIGGRRRWVVLAVKRREKFSAELTLGCGFRTFIVSVPIGMSGPFLLDVGMESMPPNP